MTRHKESGFRFERLWLRELRFEDASDQQSAPSKRQLEMDFTVSAEVADDRSQAKVAVGVKVKPTGENDFTLLTATLEGLFVPTNDEAKNKLPAFAEQQASALLVPFLREIVANVTVRARGGGILLP